VLYREGERIWHHLAIAKITMRRLDEDFIDSYLDRLGAAAFSSASKLSDRKSWRASIIADRWLSFFHSWASASRIAWHFARTWPETSDKPPMKIIGLTGSIAAGKSTVAGWIRDLGIAIHDADAAVHELLSPHGAAVGAILAEFEPDLAGHDLGNLEKGINRQALGNYVFA
jgi:hypothetical protein